MLRTVKLALRTAPSGAGQYAQRGHRETPTARIVASPRLRIRTGSKR